RAQPGERVRTVGFLVSTEDNSNLDDRVAAFRQELQRLGWGEGRIRFEVRNTSADQAQIRALAAELLALSPDVMMTITNLVTTIAARLTKTIPIVFVAADPMGSGLVANMARPGGNITGFAAYEAAIGGKWLELLKEVVPHLSRVTALYTPGGGGTEALRRLLEDSAPKLGIRATSIPASDPAAIERAISGAPDGGFIVLPGPA